MWARLLRIPRPYLYAGILFFASIGAYAANNSTFDLWLLIIIGALGFFMRRYGLPVVPAIIGIILGPAAEEQLRRALQISDGELGGLVNTAFSQIVYVVIVALLVVPPIVRAVRNRRAGGGDGTPDPDRDAPARDARPRQRRRTLTCRSSSGTSRHQRVTRP